MSDKAVKISKDVIGLRSFGRLSFNAQALYFHLLLAADGEGVVHDPKAVMNRVCASDLDLEELVYADFLTSLGESGVFIRHWTQHIGAEVDDD